MKVLTKQISLICFRVYLEVYVVKNPTCFSRWSFSNIYPYRNKKLAEDIIANSGLLISQFTADTIEKRNFIERDITLANLASKVIVVDCKENSGTMYAVKRAITLGKPVEYLGEKKELLDVLGYKQITKLEREK